MPARRRAQAVLVAALLGGTSLAAGTMAAAPGASASVSASRLAAGSPTPSVNIPAAKAGWGAGRARKVSVRAAAKAPQVHVRGQRFAPPTAAGLPGRPGAGSGPAASRGPAAVPVTAAGHRAVLPGARYRTPPTTTNANFDGIGTESSACVNAGCVMPDPGVASNGSQIAETAMERLEVYDNSGNALCGVDLNTLLGTSEALWDVRIQYDNVNDRYSMVVGVVVPDESTETPALYVAASTTSNACGSWYVYRVTFAGGSYPAGAQLDGHYLGQDRQAVLLSTDNYCCLMLGTPYEYIGSAAFAIPKSALYSGAGFSFGSFAVSQGTSPVAVAGIPMETTTNTYFLASVPGTGYNLYRMTNSGGPGTSLVLQASISSPFSAPSRYAFQPGASSTSLYPGNGYLTSIPVQSRNFVWFTHEIDLGGFPSVRYGSINTSTNAIGVAVAYRSSTSDDFNPSIAVSDASPSGAHIWLNWAYTDMSQGAAVSDTVDGVLPGGGEPNLIGTGLVTVSGAPTNLYQSFGWYSSIAVDPSSAGPGCPAGNTAIAVQQYFKPDNTWATRIARLSFC